MTSVNPTLALALGGGAARGWAHVGVIRALQAAGVRPGIVTGTSIGALVGAAYAAGELDRFEQWLRRLTFMDVMGLMDLSLDGGLIKGEKLMDFFKKSFADRPIAELGLPWGAVATDLHTGAEVWLRDGSTADAVRASMALPGLLTPVRRDGQTLVDGGLVNPVPVSLARAMGAVTVIAVDLNADILGRHLKKAPIDPTDTTNETDTTDACAEPSADSAIGDWLARLPLKAPLPWSRPAGSVSPSMWDVVATSINIMQVRITRSRMAGEPPDVIIAPRLASLGLMDFHRGAQAIAEGERASAAAMPAIEALLRG